jgi:uncharacterized metal-binding protein YceD (DUF177 family)
MLSINLRHLEDHEIPVQGELSAAEMDFGLNDEMMRAEQPVHYDLTVEKMQDALLVKGSLATVLDCQCVRCLKPFKQKLELPDWTVLLPLTGEEKVAVDNDSVDLTPYVREDILLQLPRHPLCKPDCSGLKPKARKNGGQSGSMSSAWAELDKLKLKID